MMIGKLYQDNKNSASLIFFKKLISNKFDRIMNIKIPLVDVKEVAYCALDCIEKPECFD